MYGYCPWTQAGFYCDGNYLSVATNLGNNYLAIFKWSGFFFGMGMAHEWPAVRTYMLNSTLGGISFGGSIKLGGSIIIH